MAWAGDTTGRCYAIHRTQLKLRFLLNPTSTQYAFFKEGDGSVLTVEYR